MPPLIVFRSFPNGENFNNTMGFAYNYSTGLIDETPSESIMTVTEYNFNIELIVDKFYEIIYYHLGNDFPEEIDAIEFNFEEGYELIDFFRDIFN